MTSARVYHGGAAGKPGWGGSSGPVLPPAVITALSTAAALPIIEAIGLGYLAMADKAAVPAAVPGYDVLFNDIADGATKIEFPDSSINIFVLN
jgi:hypothetical protein